MNKKICHLTSAHTRYDNRIFMKQCKSLISNGYDVTLIVNDDKPDEVLEGIKILSTGWVPKNRFERVMISKKKIMRKALEVNADIYQLHDPDLLMIGNKLKKLGKKVIFDSHEDVPQQIKDKKWIPAIIRNDISRIYELYEKSSVKNYDAVISVTPHIVERFKSINKNTIMITNYPIISANENNTSPKNKAICFIGGISEQWNHHKIIKAMESIEGIKYILAGDGTDQYISQLKSLPAWQKVDYRGRVSHIEASKIYAQSIAGMVVNYSTQIKGKGTLGNTKLFEIMDAKLPVICSNYTLWKEIIDQYQCGICVDPNNEDEVGNAINYIINNPEEASIMGENGRRAIIEKYNWKTQEETLLDLYQQL